MAVSDLLVLEDKVIELQAKLLYEQQLVAILLQKAKTEKCACYDTAYRTTDIEDESLVCRRFFPANNMFFVSVIENLSQISTFSNDAIFFNCCPDCYSKIIENLIQNKKTFYISKYVDQFSEEKNVNLIYHAPEVFQLLNGNYKNQVFDAHFYKNISLNDICDPYELLSVERLSENDKFFMKDNQRLLEKAYCFISGYPGTILRGFDDLMNKLNYVENIINKKK